MGRLTGYRIVEKDKVIETHDDLLDALERSRALACANGSSVYEVRNEDDIVLAISLQDALSTSGPMAKAVRHNLQRGAAAYRVFQPNKERPVKHSAWGKR